MAVQEKNSTRINATLVQELRLLLKDSTVLTPASQGYKESIRRWSDAVEKNAVSHKIYTKPMVQKKDSTIARKL